MYEIVVGPKTRALSAIYTSAYAYNLVKLGLTVSNDVKQQCPCWSPMPSNLSITQGGGEIVSPHFSKPNAAVSKSSSLGG